MTYRYFLRRTDIGDNWFEVPVSTWLAVAAEGGFPSGTFPLDDPARGDGSVSWGAGNWAGFSGFNPPPGVEDPRVTYNWGIRVRGTEAHAWGDVRESFEDNHMDAEDRARYWLEDYSRHLGAECVQLVRQRVEAYPWEVTE